MRNRENNMADRWARFYFLVLGCFWLMGLPQAQAHMRDYLVSQDYYTAGRGEFEVELYNDFNFAEADNSGSYSSKHQFEAEYGITDHLQLAYYEVYKWNREDNWHRDAFKIETKARFAEAGQWPVDVALYAEYENPNGRQKTEGDKLESKLILSRDFGSLNFIFNFITETDLSRHDNWDVEYTAGASYAVSPRIRLGVELKESVGTFKRLLVNKEQPLYIVPGIYATLTPHMRVLFGPAFGLTRSSDDLQLRSIVEVEF